MPKRTRTHLLPLFLLPFLWTGCGSGSSGTSGEATREPTPMVLEQSYEERGDQPLGHYTSLLQVGDALMAGTEDGLEVFTYDPDGGFTPTKHHKLQSSPAARSEVHQIRHGQGDDVWVSTSDGLARFQGTRFQLQEQSGPARDAAALGQVVWIARSNSVEVYDPGSSKISKMPILLRDGAETSDLTGTRQPLSMLHVDDSTLLVGTQFGILVAKHTGSSISWKHLYGKWDRVMGDTIFTEPGNCPLPGNRINNLRLSPDGKTVAACTDRGLATFEVAELGDWKVFQGAHRELKSGEPGKGISHEVVPGEVEMPSSDVNDVAFGPRHLYLATLKGLVRVSREGPRAEKAQLFGLEEGLPSSQVTALQVDPGGQRLYVATRYGLAGIRLTQ